MHVTRPPIQSLSQQWSSANGRHLYPRSFTLTTSWYRFTQRSFPSVFTVIISSTTVTALHRSCREEGQEFKFCPNVWRLNAVSGSSEYQPYWNRSDRTFTLAKHATGTWWQWARSSCTTHQWPTSHLLAHILFVVHSVVLFIKARPALNPAHRHAQAGRNLPPLDGRRKPHTTNSRAGPIWAKQFVKKVAQSSIVLRLKECSTAINWNSLPLHGSTEVQHAKNSKDSFQYFLNLSWIT